MQLLSQELLQVAIVTFKRKNVLQHVIVNGGKFSDYRGGV